MAAAAALVAAYATACSTPARSDADTIAASWVIEPAPPAAGRTTTTRVSLRRATQAPVSGAKLRLEGHMSHPGMTPVTTAVTEPSPGEYEARFQFSMAGDWVLVLTGELPDGARLTRQIDVIGVRPAP